MEDNLTELEGSQVQGLDFSCSLFIILANLAKKDYSYQNSRF